MKTSVRGAFRHGVPRPLVGLAEAVLGLLLILFALPAAHAADPPKVTVVSSWTDVLNSEFEDAWEPAMRLKTTDSVLVDNQISIGDKFARDSFLKGLRDFVVTGSLIKDDEILPGSKVKEFWSIPISVTGLVFVLTVAPGSGGANDGRWYTYTPPPDDESEASYTPYTGQVRIRAEFMTLLAESGVQLLRDPRFLADNNNVVLATSSGATSFAARSDPGALNLHLSRFLLAQDAAHWNTAITQPKYGYPANYVGETWPIVFGPSRALDSSMMASLADRTRDINSASPVGPQFGITTPGRLKVAQERFPLAGFRPAAIKNAAGEWVEPTTAAIALGIQAGLKIVAGKPVFTEDAALTDATALGAYPLTWLNWLHVPKTGLSIDKTNAIASFIRYIVTDGQPAHDAAGEARLPAALATESLRLADEFVKTSCVGADRVLATRTTPGPYAPDGKLTGVTSMAWCDKAPLVTTTTSAPTTTASTTTTTTTTLAPTTTTTAPPTTVAPPPTVAFVTTRTVTTTPTTTAVPTTTTAPAPATTVAPTTTIAPAVGGGPATLPFGDPQPSGGQFDQLTTMLIGGTGLVDGGRRVLRRRGQ